MCIRDRQLTLGSTGGTSWPNLSAASSRLPLCWSLKASERRVYRPIDELQADLDAWIREDNETRPDQRRCCSNKTPMQTFLEALPMAIEPWFLHVVTHT